MFLKSTALAALLAALPATLAVPAGPPVTATQSVTPRQSCPPLPSGSPVPVSTFNSAPGASNPCKFPDGYKACSTDELNVLTCTGGQWKSVACGTSSAGWKESCHTYVNALLPNADCHTGWTPWYTLCTGYEDFDVPEPNISNVTSAIRPTVTPVPAKI